MKWLAGSSLAPGELLVVYAHHREKWRNLGRTKKTGEKWWWKRRRLKAKAKTMSSIEMRIIHLSNESQSLRKRLDEETKNRIALEKRVHQLESHLFKEDAALSKEIVDSIKTNLRLLVESDNSTKYPLFISAMKKAGIALPSKLSSLRAKIKEKVKQMNRTKSGNFQFTSKTLPLDFVIYGDKILQEDLDHSLFNVKLPFLECSLVICCFIVLQKY